MKYTPKTKEELRELISNLDINLGDIDTSLITDMSGLFAVKYKFFADDGASDSEPRVIRTDFSGIENWDTSYVENM